MAVSPVSDGFAALCVYMDGITGLYVITDERLCPGRKHSDIARAAIAGGASVVQLRDKEACDRDFYSAAAELRELTRAAGVAFIVNDRVDIAAAVKADGVNLGQTDLPVRAARRVLGASAIIGVSCDSLEQALQAVRDGADYVGFGPVFRTGTKLDAGPVTGVETLGEVCRALDVPVVAIGGIGASNIRQIREAGACPAVVSAVVCADDPARAVREMVALLGEARQPGE